MRGLILRRGFALPMALMIIVTLTVAVATLFAMVATERRTVDATRGRTRALSLAESGLERFLIDRGSFGFSGLPAVYESTTVALPHGYAMVVLQRLRPVVGSAPAYYLVRSTGVDTTRQQTGVPAAQRTVSQYAFYATTKMNVLAGWTSLSGMNKNGGSGTITGIDQCGAKPAVAGAAVPGVPGYTQSGGSTVPTGSPPVDTLAATPAGAAAQVKIDWDGIARGSALTPDVTIPPGSWPSFTNPNYWPVIKIDNMNWTTGVPGNYTLPNDGRGILIVTGNLTISGTTQWNGVVMAGGTITANGNNNVEGATLSGLNVKLGYVVPLNDVGNGTKTYAYNSCAVDSALKNFGGLQAVKNARANNWAGY
jgi:Tfp pilus assembly protein PilX